RSCVSVAPKMPPAVGSDFDSLPAQPAFWSARMFEFYGQPEHFLPVVHGGPEVWPPPTHEHMSDTSNISVLGDLTASGISGTSGHGHGSMSSSSSQLAPTLVGSQGALQINLLWDSSVTSAPPGFTTEVEDAASYLTTLFSNHEVINIHVGWGE